jgi:DNA-nicking Smr family endonuclease
MSRRPRPSETDLADWAAYARTLRPLPGRAAARPPPEPAPAAPSSAPSPAPAAPARAPARAAPLAVGEPPGGVDRATWQRFRTGRLPPARKLDLHGRTAQQAFLALAGFLRACHGEGLRCVEVITGRGAGEEGGVLRRELPHWLNLPELRPLVLGAVHPHAANPGAVRLLLRRSR